MALDQVYKQNNEKVKDVSGAMHLWNRADVSGLEWWERCTSDVVGIIESLEENIEAKTTEDLDNHIKKTGVCFNVTLSRCQESIWRLWC